MPVTYMFQAPRRGPVAQSSPAKAGPGGERPDAASAPVCLSAAQAGNAMTPEVPREEHGKSANGLLPDLSQASSASRRRESEAGAQPPMDAAAAGMPTAEARDPEASPAAEAEVRAAPATHQPPVVQTHNLPVKWVPSHSRLILVARSRGGMGATSVAVNLAIELLNRRGLFSSAAHRQVALVDLDVQFGTAGSILDLEDRGGLLALARLIDEPDAQAVRNALLPHPSGLKVLPAPRTAIPLDAFDGVRVGSIIDALMAENDYVVVDLPPALVYWLEPLLKRADRLLMVTDLAVPSVVSARRVIDLMREDNSDLAVDILVSREQKPLFQRKLHRDAARALGEPLGHWLPDETKLSRQALDRGEPLVEMSPRCPWSRAVRKLARQIEASANGIKTSRKGDR